eukprot:3291602-Prymnesium_polylepis.1
MLHRVQAEDVSVSPADGPNLQIRLYEALCAREYAGNAQFGVVAPNRWSYVFSVRRCSSPSRAEFQDSSSYTWSQAQ